MAKEYVEQRENGHHIAGLRVTLASVVLASLRGESPEGIGDSFPALTLEQIYGAVAFCLAHRPQAVRVQGRSREGILKLKP